MNVKLDREESILFDRLTIYVNDVKLGDLVVSKGCEGSEVLDIITMALKSTGDREKRPLTLGHLIDYASVHVEASVFEDQEFQGYLRDLRATRDHVVDALPRDQWPVKMMLAEELRGLDAMTEATNEEDP